MNGRWSDAGMRTHFGILGPLDSEGEARAILAETEPGIYYPGHEGKEHLAYTVTTRDYEGYRVAVDCLVSSLTRFVND